MFDMLNSSQSVIRGTLDEDWIGVRDIGLQHKIRLSRPRRQMVLSVT
jgi:hypothetical protein